jgi:hypothetical protein
MALTSSPRSTPRGCKRCSPTCCSIARRPKVDGLYTNFASDPEAAAAAFGANHQRLVDLKNKYDPQNLFRMNQNIKPTV